LERARLTILKPVEDEDDAAIVKVLVGHLLSHSDASACTRLIKSVDLIVHLFYNLLVLQQKVLHRLELADAAIQD